MAAVSAPATEPLDELAVHRHLHGRAAQRLLSLLRGHAGDLEHDSAWLDNSDPVLRVAFAGAHPGLGRLLRDRLVREDPDPDLATALQVVGDRAAGGLDLAAGNPGRLKRLQAELDRR